MVNSDTSPEDDIPDVPKWVIGIVLGVRVGVGLAISVGVLYIVTLFTSLPFFPMIDPNSMFTIEVLTWIGVLGVIEFAVIGVLFYPLVFLSWLVASLFHKPLRDSLRAEWEKEQSKETA